MKKIVDENIKSWDKSKLTVEVVDGEPYEYYPLGDHVVRAIGICGGRPTFKYTRLDVDFILNEIAHGYPVDYLVNAYQESKLTKEAIQEAMMLALSSFRSRYLEPLPLAV